MVDLSVSGALQDLRVDAGELVEGGYVADEPEMVAVEEHYLSCCLIDCLEIQLPVKLVGVGDAWSQIRR